MRPAPALLGMPVGGSADDIKLQENFDALSAESEPFIFQPTGIRAPYGKHESRVSPTAVTQTHDLPCQNYECEFLGYLLS